MIKYDILSRAGYVLSHSSKRDVVIEYFFREQIYKKSSKSIKKHMNCLMKELLKSFLTVFTMTHPGVTLKMI